MGLNIRNERVCGLARQASERTGLSQTAVIGEALTAYLAALPDERAERLTRVRDMVAEFDAITTPTDIAVMRDTAEHLYNDQFLLADALASLGRDLALTDDDVTALESMRGRTPAEPPTLP